MRSIFICCVQLKCRLCDLGPSTHGWIVKPPLYMNMRPMTSLKTVKEPVYVRITGAFVALGAESGLGVADDPVARTRLRVDEISYLPQARQGDPGGFRWPENLQGDPKSRFGCHRRVQGSPETTKLAEPRDIKVGKWKSGIDQFRVPFSR
jgi:hypothetical protein